MNLMTFPTPPLPYPHQTNPPGTQKMRPSIGFYIYKALMVQQICTCSHLTQPGQRIKILLDGFFVLYPSCIPFEIYNTYTKREVRTIFNGVGSNNGLNMFITFRTNSKKRWKKHSWYRCKWLCGFEENRANFDWLSGRQTFKPSSFCSNKNV